MSLNGGILIPWQKEALYFGGLLYSISSTPLIYTSMDDFSAQLRRLRFNLGITQEQAASVLDMSYPGYVAWERGLGNPLIVTQEGALRRLQHKLDQKNKSDNSLSV